MLYPVVQLIDDRWVWLPTLLAGRVFTHRVEADELTHDILYITPDLDPVTELCNHHTQDQQLTDRSPVQLVHGYEDELDGRGIPLDLFAEVGALLLAPGTVAALGVADGELIGLRSIPDGTGCAITSTTS
jgi:hypothetical protein